ncbi:MAG TPA: cob(I)yrinic acid a,c-diamide adenosyltransferase [Candidatus Krumholzibacteria bacterium]|nr:cob(I)yrinic acid a,c-diamide adenosyltransferase [Candidatus Krumholzibacteria bacterium]
MVRIYTRTGDDGNTGLIGGARVRKSDRRVDLYGTADELNAHLGLAAGALVQSDGDAAAQAGGRRLRDDLLLLQSRLFDLGALLADPDRCEELTRAGAAAPGLAPEVLEAAIDSLDADLAPLRTFILPGGTAGAAHLHVARTVCRRLERDLVLAAETIAVPASVLIWINRLSDWLFTAARWANFTAGVPDVPWTADRGEGAR